MEAYDFVTAAYKNISDERESEDKFSDAEQISNLLHRVLQLARFLNVKDMPPIMTEVQLGLIYERLKEIEEHFELEPEYIEQ